MAEVIRMPKMSDTMTEGVIVGWNKKVGDTVAPGDILAEVETDKATMELENYVKGTLLHIGIPEGSAVPVDGIIAIVGKEGEDFSALLEGDAPAKEDKKEAKNEGEENSEEESSDEETSEEETSEEEADTDEESTEEKPSKKGEEPKKGEKVEKSASAAPVAETTKKDSTDTDARVKASPLAKKIAEDKGININEVSGSGDNGRIIKKDIENYKPAASTSSAAAVAGAEGFEEVNVSQMRKTIARRLAESKFSAPHFYLTMEIEMDKAMAARKSINEYAPTKISMNDMIVKASALALRKNPKVNSSWLGDKIRYNNHIHIGVAMAVDEGLLVPVVKFADSKSLSDISSEVKNYSEKAKSKKLQPSDWEGNTFTISNLGMFGIEEFTAIINPPDACILAVGGVKETVIVKNGEMKPGNVMKVTLSCDHRVVDGVVGSQFLQTLKELLEEPMKMLV